jgi:hypothetical protein
MYLALKYLAISNTEAAEVILCKMKYVFHKHLQAICKLGNRCYYANKQLLSNKLLNYNSKIQIYKTII